ncbi:MAG: class I SAM-dependent methyltransferase family protein [Candidatus Geothermarchaeales archaeon]
MGVVHLRLKEALYKRIGERASLAYSAMDVIGDIVIVKIPRELLKHKEEVGKAVLDTQKKARAVYQQVQPVSGQHRTRRLELLAGEPGTQTEHREHGCVYLVDVSQVYFSPRLSHERRRICQLVGSRETVVNMFAGVGPYSILIAKERPDVQIYSIDISPRSVWYHRVNSKRNKVYDRIRVIQGDARVILRESLTGVADRVLLPYPALSLESLPSAVEGLRISGWLHVYLHSSYERIQEEALVEAESMVGSRLQNLGVTLLGMRAVHVREVQSRTSQVCVDVELRRRASLT